MATNPLDKNSRDRLAAARRRAKDAFELIAKAKACDLDVSEREQTLLFLLQKLDLLQASFSGLKEVSEIGCKPRSERFLPDGNVEVIEECDDGSTNIIVITRDGKEISRSKGPSQSTGSGGPGFLPREIRPL